MRVAAGSALAPLPGPSRLLAGEAPARIDLDHLSQTGDPLDGPPGVPLLSKERINSVGASHAGAAPQIMHD